MLIFAKNADISKIKRVLVVKGIFYETIYVCLPTYQILSFLDDSNDFKTGLILPPKNEPLKSPP